MVGLPGTGKSTRASELSNTVSDIYVYSPDTVLHRIAKETNQTYDDLFEQYYGYAVQASHRFLLEAIEHKRNVVWDQSNLKIEKRKEIMSLVRPCGYTVICEYRHRPFRHQTQEFEEWQRRINDRNSKILSPDFIDLMERDLEIPTVSEGFDELVAVDIYGKLLG